MSGFAPTLTASLSNSARENGLGIIESMDEMLMTCPQCGHEFGVSEALQDRIRAELKERLADEYEERLKREVSQAEWRAREALRLELADLREQLAEQQQKAQQAEQNELALRKKARELEERQQELDLESERRLEAERKTIERRTREQVDEVQNLKPKETERQIEELRRALEEARRKSQQGSQERQGEVLELDIERALSRQFPQDDIRPVPKGTRGADLIQEVRNNSGRSCGLILWEMKNTKHFQPAWIDKLKEDQRNIGAALAVIVSVALPDDIREFGRVEGVWVASLRVWPALALALREQLLQISFVRAASEGQNEKIELLYRYLSGNEFRHRVEAIVEAFSAMHDQLLRERRAMERHWTEREKQINRILSNTAGLYGSIRGLIGAGMPEIQALTLGNAALEEGSGEQEEEEIEA